VKEEKAVLESQIEEMKQQQAKLESLKLMVEKLQGKVAEKKLSDTTSNRRTL
jgi:hypothetical protein